MGRRSERAVALFFAIFGATLVAYWPALHGGPLWDDFSHITVPELRSFEGLWRIWSELGATQQYYPLLHSAFWLEHRLWGDSFVGSHLAGIALHSAAAFLLVLILRHLEVRGALFAGLIFALHPVCVESVAWISEQKNTLSAVFYLASAYGYLRLVERGQQPSAADVRVRLKADTTDAMSPSTVVSGFSRTFLAAQTFRTLEYWIAFALFICALLTKTVTATLPAALLLVLWWQRGLPRAESRGRIDWRRDVLPLVPWFAVAALAGLFTIWFEHDVIGARGADFTLSFLERLLLAGRVVWFYLDTLFWPAGLNFMYPRWTIDASVAWQYLFSIMAVALAIALGMLARQHHAFPTSSHIAPAGRRGALAGYLFFVGTLVPVLGFVNVFPFLFSYVADHFQYLASLGIIVPVAGILAIVTARFGLSAQRVLAAALLVTLGVLTWNRSAVYRDAETLYRDVIARNPESWMAYQNLGTELASRNRFLEAIDAFEGALRVRPAYLAGRNNLVLAHMKLGDAAAEVPDRIASAIWHYESVLRIEPDHFRAHYNLGTVLMDLPERHAEAITHLEAAVRKQPESTEARVNLGIALADIPARAGEAIEHLEVALAKRPDLTPVRVLLERLRAEAQSASGK
jgi:tetratricopeptide (TPR) repeat protein